MEVPCIGRAIPRPQQRSHTPERNRTLWSPLWLLIVPPCGAQMIACAAASWIISNNTHISVTWSALMATYVGVQYDDDNNVVCCLRLGLTGDADTVSLTVGDDFWVQNDGSAFLVQADPSTLSQGEKLQRTFRLLPDTFLPGFFALESISDPGNYLTGSSPCKYQTKCSFITDLLSFISYYINVYSLYSCSFTISFLFYSIHSDSLLHHLYLF